MIRSEFYRERHVLPCPKYHSLILLIVAIVNVSAAAGTFRETLSRDDMRRPRLAQRRPRVISLFRCAVEVIRGARIERPRVCSALEIPGGNRGAVVTWGRKIIGERRVVPVTCTTRSRHYFIRVSIWICK